MLCTALHGRQISGRPLKIAAASKNFVESLDAAQELTGHTGCVNALDWSADGRFLASGSDDRRVIIWDAYTSDYQRCKDIYTGHTRNIFSVKFLPGASDSTIITAAGDSSVRVFDIEYGSATTSILHEPCHRTIYRAHRDRVKHIEIEHDGHCFLTASEDGDVRHFDLRDNASQAYRAPLISYAAQQIDLTTMSINSARPYLLALAGSHPLAFLHDRRMIGRDMMSEWGAVPNSRTPTQCVRNFKSGSRRSRSRRSRQVTALKFGRSDPTELICSWLNDDIYLFDIHANNDELVHRQAITQTPKHYGRMSDHDWNMQSSSSFALQSGGTLEFPESCQPRDIVSITCTYLLCSDISVLNHNESYENFVQSFNAAMWSSEPDNVLLLEHLADCKTILGALANLPTASAAEIEASPSNNWYSRAILCISQACDSRIAEPELLKPLAEFPFDDDQCISQVSSSDKILFSTHSDLVQTLNDTIRHKSSLEHMKLSSARKFWIDEVCRALLIESVQASHLVHLPTGDTESAPLSWLQDTELVGQELLLDSDRDAQSVDDIMESEDDLEEASDLEQTNMSQGVYGTVTGADTLLPIRSFSGHVNVETIKDVNFLGLEDEYVMSGSDDGLLVIWDKSNGRIVTMLQGDDSVTNVMEANPSCTSLAVSGIDDCVKIFQPHHLRAPGAHFSNRRVTQSEYEVRARNKLRAQGDVSYAELAMSRNLMLQIADQMGEHQQCRQQ